MDYSHSRWFHNAVSMNMRRTRSRLIDKRNKRIYQLYHRYRAINKELWKKFHVHLNSYLSLKNIDEIDEFLKLRDEVRLNPLGYYLKIYEDDQDFFSE